MTQRSPGVVAIVDDDRAVLDSLRFLLEVIGYQVVTHASAEAFLNDRGASHMSGPTCLILDQHMPRMTGLELARALRDDGDEIPILLITGSPSPAIAQRAAQLGIVDVLEKPPEEEDLLNFLKMYI